VGSEHDLAPGTYTLGSQRPSDIVIPDPSIAARHVTLEVHADHVMVHDCSGGGVTLVNGRPVTRVRLAPGDTVTVGKFGFQMVNSSLPSAPPAGLVARGERWLMSRPLYARSGIITGAVAITLYVLLQATGNPVLVPVALLAMSAVVPAMLLCYVVPRYDQSGISLRTLALTFLAGGTIGIVVTVVLSSLGAAASGGLLLIPIFAGLWEEPGKLAATAWRWRHPGYDRPMDGLILGMVSGLGFAVFETAGYGFTTIVAHIAVTAGDGTAEVAASGLQQMFSVMVMRGLLSPFGHGLWTGMVVAAFWQEGRDVRRATRSRVFLKALAYAIGLHALWNAQMFIGFIGPLASGYLSVRLFRQLLQNKGFAR
jgi:RsiW-degrading membrane proteinase PrsW (M82 family)